MRRSLGFVVVLLFVFASSALARGGPPVPDGCTFERGVRTCVTLSEPYFTNIPLSVGDVFCSVDRQPREVTFDLGGAAIITARDEVTTEYFGLSHVMKSESTRVLASGYFNAGIAMLDGSC